mgnify:CR=1 FL=1
MTELTLVQGMWCACFVTFVIITIYAVLFYFKNVK